MSTLSASGTGGTGIVLAGLKAGLRVAVITSLTLFFAGAAITIIADQTGWPRLGEYKTWLAVIGLEYGFLLGLIIGAVVCVRFCWCRLRDR